MVQKCVALGCGNKWYPGCAVIFHRAEPGNHIVLVVQLQSEESLASACSENSNQLLVYEIGETFGGYWGPLPDSVLKQSTAVDSRLYTKSVAEETTREKLRLETTTESTTTSPTTKTSPTGSSDADTEGDFIRVEVPIVDVVGRDVESPEGNKEAAFDPDETFDLLYDVTPERSGRYRTKILPVVQFAVKQSDGRRNEEPRFDLDYEAPPYTADIRLQYGFNEFRNTKRRQSSFYVNRLLNFKRTKTTPRITKGTLNFKDNLFLKHNDITSSPISRSTKTEFIHLSSPANQSWNHIEKVVKKINESTNDLDKYQNGIRNISSLIETVVNLKHNYSVYLAPDWLLLSEQNISTNYLNVTPRFQAFTRKPLTFFTYATKNIHHFTKMTLHPKLLIKEIYTEANEKKFTKNNETKTEKSFGSINTHTNSGPNITVTSKVETPTQKLVEPIKAITENIIHSNSSTQMVNVEVASSHETRPLLMGSMVGHESWENVVQAAPVMAVHLNKTVKSTESFTSTTSADKNIQNPNTTSTKKQVRKKRKINAIAIENARPHTMPTTASVATSTATSFGFSDMQEFVQLVELRDDELHERVALRYLRQYVGPMLFNLCASGEPKAKHVYLFNSSRIVMAVNNFSLERMTVMLTPAQAIVGTRARCSRGSLECQVYGSRICIDNMNACDGVPNCGAYDIYDEDRLMCGAAGGLQHNVCLAAVTFLALLLTIMYTVHYWLKRCVPKVSEAFFIYTDGAENILYLETIMRSPHDIGDGMVKMVYQGPLTDDDIYHDACTKSKRNVIWRIFTTCINFLKCKRKKKKKVDLDAEDDFFNNFNEPRQVFSFAEVEMNKLHQTEKSDAEVQTGDSLQMSHINILQNKDSVQDKPVYTTMMNRRKAKASVSDTSLNVDFQSQESELSLLKFLKEVKSEIEPSTSRDVASKLCQRPREEEEELRIHLYESEPTEKRLTKHSPHETSLKTHKVLIDKPKSSKPMTKRLRFDEEAVAIPYSDADDEDCIHQISNIELEDRKKKEDVDKIDGSHPSAGTSRDFRFWKNKKSKKKAHLAIR